MENLLAAIHIIFTSYKVRDLRLSAIDRSEGAIFEGSTHQLKATTSTWCQGGGRAEHQQQEDHHHAFYRQVICR